jgi:septal ring factor EnvC (AmiA/AmiB activator)
VLIKLSTSNLRPNDRSTCHGPFSTYVLLALWVACLIVQPVLSQEPLKDQPPVIDRPPIAANGDVDGANEVIFEAAVPLDPRRDNWLRSELLSGRSEAWARLQSDRSLTQSVSELQTQCKLTSEQTTKLLLAGRGDIAKYFRDIDDLYSELKPLASTEIENRKDLASFLSKPEIQAKMLPFKNRWRSGLHGAGSLYQGVVIQTLTPEQIKSIASQSQQRDELRLKQKMMSFVVNVEKSMPLTSDQRSKLLQKLLSHHAKHNEPTTKDDEPAEDKLADLIAIQEPNRLKEDDYRLAPMIAAMKLKQKDLEEFLDPEQVKTMIALQRHWRLNVPLLNSIEE